MSPKRSIKVGNFIVEEFYWHGDLICYANGVLTTDDYRTTCIRIIDGLLPNWKE